MKGKSSRTIALSVNDRANQERLAALGIKVNPDGTYEESGGKAFEGQEEPNPPASGDPSAPVVESVSTVQTLASFEPLEEEPSEDVLPAQPAAEPIQEPLPAKPRDGEQTPEGLAKREADARAAQQAMSKAQAKLDKTLNEVNRRFGDLDDQIQKLAALQTTVGSIPPDLNPADAATVAQYREDYPEAIGVMESLVAPIYNMLSQVREQINAVVKQQSEFFVRLKEEEVFGGVYSKIPKERVAQITESPEFIEWLSGQTPSVRKLYIGILNETSRYSAEEALGVFNHFSKDTGIDIGLNGSRLQPKPQRAPTPPMDSYPTLRTGSALPAAPTPQQVKHAELPESERPLSPQEQRDFKQLVANAQGARERDMLYKRLNLTPLPKVISPGESKPFF